MPLMLEWVLQPSEQDVIDLGKMLAEGMCHTPDVEAWLNECHSNKYKVAAGRFNDRLISLVLVKQAVAAIGQSNPGCVAYELSNLWVREVTRQRGVAKQLMVRLCQWADQEKATLQVADPAHEWRTLLEFGFLYENGCWTRQR